jgi:hypothetical protein
VCAFAAVTAAVCGSKVDDVVAAAVGAWLDVVGDGGIVRGEG